MGWNQHRRTYGSAYHSNGTLTGRRYADEILRTHVIPYAGAIEIRLLSRMIMPRPHRVPLVESMLEAANNTAYGMASVLS
ncbi:hypothetical protein TNCV_3347561 [Trichonephila clavipes]|nr:hypothetical protein TNCV_3347561 [Trichonephila clavipes]